MEDKVLCPYCGSEMKRWTQYELPNQTHFTVRYICGECGATSPQRVHRDRERANELAKEAALKRFKPLQKPITFEEIENTIFQIPCWIEKKETNELFTDVLDKDSGGYYGKINIATFREVDYMYLSQYNKTWRCWATNPTDEERQAAEWDTTQK